MKGLNHVVEGRTLAVPADAQFVAWEPVAAFRHADDAAAYLKRQGEINGESCLMDQLQVRMKEKKR